jgi:flagellar hook-associated protein 2
VGSGTAVTIPPSGTASSLTNLVQDINSANAGVTASVVTDAAGARLALVSNQSGLAGDINVTGNTVGLNMTKSVIGKDASAVVDGIPIDSASNTVTSIAGLTLNLQNANPNETVTIGVSADTSTATSAIQSFVDSYNKVIGDINAQAATGTNSSAVLVGDPTIRDIQARILTDVTASLIGNGGMSNLQSMGLEMGDDGTLTVNTTNLNSALTTNFAQVQNLFQNASGGVATTFSSDLYSLTDVTQGEIALTVQGDNNTIASLGTSIGADQVSLAAQQISLTTEYNTINTTLESIPTLEAQTAAQLQNA